MKKKKKLSNRKPTRKRSNRTPAGRAYQELVALIMKALDPGAIVRCGEWVQGPDGRLDMDVSIRAAIDGRPVLAVIECKDFDVAKTGKVGRPFVDALDSKRQDLNADFAFICSNSGFTTDALMKAKRKHIGMISALCAGDRLVKARIEEEIYFRRIKLGTMLITYGGRSINKETNPSDLKYNGKPVVSWLMIRAGLVAFANPLVSEQITLEFRLVRPTLLHFGDVPVELESMKISFTPSTRWFAQVVQLDASLGIYDYLRGKVKLTGGANQYLIKDLDFDKGTPIDFIPEAAELGVGLLPGEIGVFFAMIEDGSLGPSVEAPDLTDMILPQDLALEWPRAL